MSYNHQYKICLKSQNYYYYILRCNNIYFVYNERLILVEKHSYSYEQYCPIVNKNIIILETSYYNGNKKIRCLNLYKCKKELGGCKDKFVLAKQENIRKSIEKNTL